MVVARNRSRCDSVSTVISCPAILMEPVSGLTIPAIKLRKVVFPLPLSPFNPSCFPAAIENSPTDTTCFTSPSGVRYDFARPLILRTVSASLIAGGWRTIGRGGGLTSFEHQSDYRDEVANGEWRAS